MFDLLRSREIHRAIVIAAHPDDEVIGAGGILGNFPEVFVIHTTNGSPLDLTDANRNGFNTGAEYAAARRREVVSALALAGVPEEHVFSLGFTDQQTIHHLPELCRALETQLLKINPDVVLTHPYEGGHPDHDSTAFAIHRCWPHRDRLFEMTLYHAGKNGEFVTGKFLPNGGVEIARELTREDKLRKERMIKCFVTQAPVLAQFPVRRLERFREAPVYDFTQPPHPGILYYERMRWGVSGAEWRRIAAACE